MPVRIYANHFSAASQVYRVDQNGLTPAMRGLAQSVARIAASAVPELVDNSGGAAADGTLDAIAAFTPAALGTDDAVQKAALEAGFATIVDALKEILTQCNQLHAKVPALAGVLVDNLSGTAADGTIGVISTSYSGVGASMASAVGANAVLTDLRNRIAQLGYAVDTLSVACGVPPLVDNSGGLDSTSLVVADVAVSTGAPASGADTGAANAIVKAANATAVMGSVADAIKELATKLNACRSATGGTALVLAA
ncbi:MAG: hypothetical protein AB7F22_35935 [Reyranella sp.]|uniref:hypothetical protein n=1 Tax=Reyranella sp. TaxID=1929291 RepID=UPI003D0F7A26